MEKNRYMFLNYTFFDKCRKYKNDGYLLFNLVWEAKYRDTKTLETGCIDLNKSKLAREINLSTATINSCLRKLENKKELEISKTDKNTYLRVINYKEYFRSKNSKTRGYKLINQTFVDEIRKDKKYFTLWMYLIRFAKEGCVERCYTENIAKAVGCAKDKFIEKRNELIEQGLIYKTDEKNSYSLKVIHYKNYTEKENKESANFALEQQKNATPTDKKGNGDLIKNATPTDKKGNPYIIINNNKGNINSFNNNTRMVNLEEETLSLNTNQSGSAKEKEKPTKEKEKPAKNTTSGYTDSGVYQTNAPNLIRVEDLKYAPTYAEKHYSDYVRWVMNTYVNSDDFHKWVDDYDVRWEIIGIWCREFCENEIKNNRDHLQDLKGDGSLFFHNITKHLRNYIKVCYNKYKKSMAGHNVI